MRIKLHRDYVKGFNRLKASEKEKFRQRRGPFLLDEFNLVLNNHPVRGKYQGFRSFNLTGDLRVIYKRNGMNGIFVVIDIHSNLYG